MTLIDTTGTSLVTYRGTGMVLVQEDSSTVLCRGYYEAAQFPSGALNVSFVPTQRPRGATGAHSRSMPCNLTFSGESLGGSSLHSSGEPLFSRNAWLLSPAWRPPTELTFLPAFLRVRQRGQASIAYAKSRFLVSNFLWHDQDAREPDSLLLDMQGFRVTIDPTPDYLDTARRLGQLGGVEPTGYITIEFPEDDPQDPTMIMALLDKIICILRLISGNRVNWYYGDFSVSSQSTSAERFLKYSVPQPYSSIVRLRPVGSDQVSAIPKLDILNLLHAFITSERSCEESRNLKGIINKFVSSCDNSTIVEASGLQGYALIEVMAAKHAVERGGDPIVPEEHFVKDIFPNLRKALKGTTLEKDKRREIGENLRGAYRRFFRNRLTAMAKEIECDDLEPHIRNIIDHRNSLVHQGSYGEDLDDEEIIQRYALSVWSNFVLLCRTIGYKGALPEFGGKVPIVV